MGAEPTIRTMEAAGNLAQGESINWSLSLDQMGETLLPLQGAVPT